MTQSKPRRGRPATIDTQAAMSALVELFRAKGYAAVSLDDLSDATGLSRPSLYRSFGNKLAMYIGAMDAFGAQVAETALPALEKDGPLTSALSGFYDAMLDIYYRDGDIAPGCLVFGTAPSSADEEKVQARLRFGIQQLDARMRLRLRRAAPHAATVQMDTAVQMSSNTLIAFTARAKSGATKTDLRHMGTQTAQAISDYLKVPH